MISRHESSSDLICYYPADAIVIEALHRFCIVSAIAMLLQPTSECAAVEAENKRAHALPEAMSKGIALFFDPTPIRGVCFTNPVLKRV